MSITHYNQPYAVTVQQTPDQWYADGNTGFPEKYVYEYFEDYNSAKQYFWNLVNNNADELIAEYTNGIVDLYEYSPTSGDAPIHCVWFYEDGTIENHGIETATEYGLF